MRQCPACGLWNPDVGARCDCGQPLTDAATPTARRRWIVASLFRPTGTIERGSYALIGVLGFALKHNLDRLLATAVFHRPWTVFNYLVVPDSIGSLSALSRADVGFLAALIAVAVPFIWVGVAQTLRRLRAVGWPLGLVVLFFVPAVNLCLFLILALVPSRSRPDERPAGGALSRFDRSIPDDPLGSAVVALVLTVVFGVAATVFGAQILRYGWGLFVGLPFAMGFISVLTYGSRRPRSLGACVTVAMLSVVVLGAALFALAIEGLICLVMAAPIALALALLGGIAGYVIQRGPRAPNQIPMAMLALCLAVPGLMGAESLALPVAPQIAVTTSVIIQAPPERVWPHVVQFTELPPPTEWLFRLGIAYPVRATISGRGPGALRRCEFSTGAFLEPITVWDEPRRLRFTVTDNPPPMQEWTPYRAIHPPHLDGFLRSDGGEFLLTPLPGGATRLDGTTWYRHHMWPVGYWQLWSDAIIHRIHRRVLLHIRRATEHAGV